MKHMFSQFKELWHLRYYSEGYWFEGIILRNVWETIYCTVKYMRLPFNKTEKFMLNVIRYLVPIVVTLMIVNVALPEECCNDELDYEAFYADLIRQHEEDVKIFGHWLEYVINHEIDWVDMVIYMKVDGLLTEGTDISCLMFWKMMYDITSIGFIIYIENEGWIPSKSKIINHKMAVILSEPEKAGVQW